MDEDFCWSQPICRATPVIQDLKKRGLSGRLSEAKSGEKPVTERKKAYTRRRLFTLTYIKNRVGFATKEKKEYRAKVEG